MPRCTGRRGMTRFTTIIGMLVMLTVLGIVLQEEFSFSRMPILRRMLSVVPRRVSAHQDESESTNGRDRKWNDTNKQRIDYGALLEHFKASTRIEIHHSKHWAFSTQNSRSNDKNNKSKKIFTKKQENDNHGNENSFISVGQKKNGLHNMVSSLHYLPSSESNPFSSVKIDPKSQAILPPPSSPHLSFLLSSITSPFSFPPSWFTTAASLSSSMKHGRKSKDLTEFETDINLTHEKFIIYVCDKSKYCYGLGDRQRAVSSLYLLSIVTNRTFGVIWTQPCPLTQFLQPNEVNWKIPSWKLKGRSSIELEFLKPKHDLRLDIPFNQQYPQDIVYIRTNHNLHHGLMNTPPYKARLPAWARKRVTYVHGHVWKMLMRPTELIRDRLNDMLVKIHGDQRVDDNLVNSLRSSKICRRACEIYRRYEAELSSLKNSYNTAKNGEIRDGSSSATTVLDSSRLENDKYVLGCVAEIRRNSSLLIPKDYNYNERLLLNDESAISWRSLNVFCKSELFKRDRGESKKMNVDTIRKAKGYDVVDLNLVCIHARIGRNPDMVFDKPRNSIESTKVLWDFARPYMEKGQHLYIATDYDKVRQDSKVHFGLRAHSSDTPIVHIASVQKNQNETEGMALALWEQLLLMTSCKTLVQSHSGFSILAGAVREDLLGNDERYWFEGGKIKQIW